MLLGGLVSVDCEILTSPFYLKGGHHSLGSMQLTTISINAGDLLDLHDKLLGHASPFWHGVLRTTQAFKLGLRLRCGQESIVKF